MKPSLGRAALFGLGAGLLAGALFLIVSAVRATGFECGELPADECALQAQTAAELARFQALAAVALGLGAVAAFLLLRKPAGAAPPAP